MVAPSSIHSDSDVCELILFGRQIFNIEDFVK